MSNDFRLLMLGAMYENGGNTTHRFLDGHPELFVSLSSEVARTLPAMATEPKCAVTALHDARRRRFAQNSHIARRRPSRSSHTAIARP